jgi:hypothetical protein
MEDTIVSQDMFASALAHSIHDREVAAYRQRLDAYLAAVTLDDNAPACWTRGQRCGENRVPRSMYYRVFWGWILVCVGARVRRRLCGMCVCVCDVCTDQPPQSPFHRRQTVPAHEYHRRVRPYHRPHADAHTVAPGTCATRCRFRSW